MAINLLNISLILLLTSCNPQGGEKKEDTNKQATVLSLPNDWQKDKDGCLKLRNEKLANKLISENNLKGSHKIAFLNIFGKANEIDNTNKEEVLIYYFDCVCNSGKLNVKGDKCYAKFHFENGKLKTEEFICE